MEQPPSASGTRRRSHSLRTHHSWNVRRRPTVARSLRRRGRESNSTRPFHQVMKHTIPSCVAILALKYQNKPLSQLEDNPVLIWCFVTSIMVYWLIAGNIKGIPNTSKLYRWLNHAVLAAGLLSGLSLLSILLPSKVYFVPLMIWILLVLFGFAWLLFSWIYHRIRTKIITSVHNIVRAPGNWHGIQESEIFSEKDGLPKRAFPNGWKGKRGLYAVGFTKRGLLGTSMDAKNIAADIESCIREESS